MLNTIILFVRGGMSAISNFTKNIKYKNEINFINQERSFLKDEERLSLNRSLRELVDKKDDDFIYVSETFYYYLNTLNNTKLKVKDFILYITEYISFLRRFFRFIKHSFKDIELDKDKEAILKNLSYNIKNILILLNKISKRKRVNKIKLINIIFPYYLNKEGKFVGLELNNLNLTELYFEYNNFSGIYFENTFFLKERFKNNYLKDIKGDIKII